MERVEAFLNLVGYKIIHTERDLDEKNHQSIFVHCEPEVPRAHSPGFRFRWSARIFDCSYYKIPMPEQNLKENLRKDIHR